MKKFNSVLNGFASATLALGLISCSQNSPSASTGAVTEEEQVLQTSVFYPGELTPEAMSFVATNTGESGTIAGGPGSGDSNDGGSIPAPGGTDGGSDGGNTADNGGSTDGSTGSGGSNSGDSNGGTSGDGTVAGGGSNGGTGGGSSGGSDAGGSDGGTIDGGGSNGGGSDGGTVAGGDDPDGGSDGGSTDGGTDGGSDNGTDPGDGTVAGGDDPDGGTGGSTDPADGDDDGTVADGGTDGGTDGGGSDGGAIDDGGTSGGGSDDGTVAGGDDPNDGNDDGTTGGGSDDPGDGTVADGDDPTDPDGGTDPSDDGNNDDGTVADGDDPSDPNDGGNNDDGTVADGDDPSDSDDGNTDDGTVADGGDPNGGDDGGTVDDGTDPGHDDDGGHQCVEKHTNPKVHEHGGMAKVTICHIPPGNPANAHNITIGEPAVQAHLDHGDVLGPCGCGEETVEMKVKFSRICSQYRSGIPYPSFVFFEEAVNPVLSVEAGIRVETPVSKKDRRQLASAGWGRYWNWKWRQRHRPATYHYVPLHSVDLRGLNLFDGRHVEQLDMTLQGLRDSHPEEWSRANITVQVCDDTNYNGSCSDEVYPYVLSVNKPSFTAAHVPAMVKMDVWHGRHMLLKNDPEFCEKQYSPIVLDLGGNGILLSGPGQGTVFDLNDTGAPVYTGWTQGMDDALLVRDVNGNGVIDSGAELFGSATRLKDGSRATDGYQALGEWDTNQDGEITPDDAIWGELRLWLDQDSSGTSEPHELLTLDQVGLESMDLAYVSMREVDKWGNETRMRSTFRRQVRGESRAMAMIDVWFNTLVAQDLEPVASR